MVPRTGIFIILTVCPQRTYNAAVITFKVINMMQTLNTHLFNIISLLTQLVRILSTSYI
jgi:hypothetical protein